LVEASQSAPLRSRSAHVSTAKNDDVTQTAAAAMKRRRRKASPAPLRRLRVERAGKGGATVDGLSDSGGVAQPYEWLTASIHTARSIIAAWIM